MVQQKLIMLVCVKKLIMGVSSVYICLFSMATDGTPILLIMLFCE
jgi:hypothetical protein